RVVRAPGLGEVAHCRVRDGGMEVGSSAWARGRRARRRRVRGQRPLPGPVRRTPTPHDARKATLTSSASLDRPAAGVPHLTDTGLTTPSPTQAATLPDTLRGRDVLGRGRTGSGKTLAFSLPLVTRLADGRRVPNRPRGLVLVPTRELAN